MQPNSSPVSYTMPEALAHAGDASSPATSTSIAVDAIAAQAAREPDAPALHAACGTISRGDLDARADRVAAWLRAEGVAPGDLVGLCLERSFDQIVAALATWKAGAAYLPLDPAWPDGRLRTIVGEAGCTLVVGRDDTAERLRDARVAALDEADPLPPIRAMAGDLAYVIYTSGSTGTPKGVEVTHGNLAHLVAWHCADFGVTAADRGVHLAGLGFDASVWEVWPLLAAGGAVSLAPDGVRTSATALKDWLIEDGATIAFAPTALAEEMIAAAWAADAKLRVLLTGADRLVARPLADLQFRFVNNYGPTECTVVATSGTVHADGAGLPSLGRPIGATVIYLVSPDGVPVPDGEPGEIMIGGPSVARGYRGRADLTADRFLDSTDGGRFYRTGDLAVRRSDGSYDFRGRVDDQVKVRGHRVEPGEVASVLRDHPHVESCAVIARAGSDGETQLVAYCVAAPTTAAEGLRDYLAETPARVHDPGRLRPPRRATAQRQRQARPRGVAGAVRRQCLRHRRLQRGGVARRGTPLRDPRQGAGPRGVRNGGQFLPAWRPLATGHPSRSAH